MNATQVAQHVEVKRGRLKGFQPALPQAIEVPLGCGQFGLRNAAFSASSQRASLTSPDMNTSNAILSESMIRLWNADNSSTPSGEN